MNKQVDYFYHATGDNDETYDTMLKIILDGEIKSKRMQKSELGCSLYNGDDYISLAAWNDEIFFDSKEFFFQSSFPGFIYGLPCFIISGDIPAIKCSLCRGKYDSSKERVSQYQDEWHVKDKINLDNVVGIALPSTNYNPEDEYKKKEILEFAKLYNWEIFVSDENLVKAVRERFSNQNKKEK